LHAPVFSPYEKVILNHLVGKAITQPDLRQRLLQHDTQLICEFNLSLRIWGIISEIHAATLQDFCMQLVVREYEN